MPQLDPAAHPAVVLASVPALVAALARRPRTAASLTLLPLVTSLFFRDPARSPDREPVTDPDLVLAGRRGAGARQSGPTRVRPGDVVATGDRVGVMGPGSRMDVFVSPDAHLLVGQGERTAAGETPLARWPR